MVLRLAAGIELRDDPIALSVLEEGVVTKEFLSLDHTAKWFREEGYYPSDVIDRSTLGEWEAAGGKDSAERASERVRSILSSHEPEPLEESVAAYLREVMQQEALEAGLEALPELALDDTQVEALEGSSTG
jgi:trimethylamine--corrinoid protein Co-methyltransferase